MHSGVFSGTSTSKSPPRFHLSTLAIWPGQRLKPPWNLLPELTTLPFTFRSKGKKEGGGGGAEVSREGDVGIKVWGFIWNASK